MFKAPQITMRSDKQIPVSMDGGLNISAPADQLRDNQSPDMLNMWMKDGVLRARPGFVCKSLGFPSSAGGIVSVSDYMLLYRRTTTTKDANGNVTDSSIEEKSGIFIVTEHAVFSYDGYTLTQLTVVSPNGQPYVDTYVFDFSNSTILSAQKSTTVTRSVPQTGFTFKSETEYDNCVIVGNGLFFANYNYVQSYLNIDAGFWTGSYGAAPIYTPVIMTAAAPSGAGQAAEARNLINPKVIEKFSTNATDTSYVFVDQSIDNEAVVVTYDALDGNGSHTASFAPDATSATLTVGTGSNVKTYSLTLDRTAGKISISAALADASAANAVNNFTVQYSKTVYTDNPVGKCNIAAWFGGVYQGDETGNYLFLSGDPANPNKVLWSKPTKDGSVYFPETNINYLGNPSEAITAFAKEFNVLIVFKERSIYRITYEYSDTASVSNFPAQEVRSGIGCDIPGSIQTINNYLVWGNTDGTVYTLLSTVIKDERIIRALSKNIGKKLSYLSEDAVSYDDGENYFLFSRTSVFVWNYNSTPYKNSSDTEESQEALAWYYWEIPMQLLSVFNFSGFICAFYQDGRFAQMNEKLASDYELSTTELWNDADVVANVFPGDNAKATQITGGWAFYTNTSSDIQPKALTYQYAFQAGHRYRLSFYCLGQPVQSIFLHKVIGLVDQDILIGNFKNTAGFYILEFTPNLYSDYLIIRGGYGHSPSKIQLLYLSIRELQNPEIFDAHWTSKQITAGLPQYYKLPYKVYFTLLHKIRNVNGFLIDLSIPTETSVVEKRGRVGLDPSAIGNETFSNMEMKNTAVWTKKFQLSVKRVPGDDTPFGIQGAELYLRIGRAD